MEVVIGTRDRAVKARNALLLLRRNVLGGCELRGGQETAQDNERLALWFWEHQKGFSCKGHVL